MDPEVEKEVRRIADEIARSLPPGCSASVSVQRFTRWLLGALS